jgi:hypothetical protein
MHADPATSKQAHAPMSFGCAPFHSQGTPICPCQLLRQLVCVMQNMLTGAEIRSLADWRAAEVAIGPTPQHEREPSGTGTSTSSPAGQEPA